MVPEGQVSIMVGRRSNRSEHDSRSRHGAAGAGTGQQEQAGADAATGTDAAARADLRVHILKCKYEAEQAN